MSWSLALPAEARCLYASRAGKIGESVGCTRLVRAQSCGKECADFMQEKKLSFVTYSRERMGEIDGNSEKRVEISPQKLLAFACNMSPSWFVRRSCKSMDMIYLQSERS